MLEARPRGILTTTGKRIYRETVKALDTADMSAFSLDLFMPGWLCPGGFTQLRRTGFGHQTLLRCLSLPRVDQQNLFLYIPYTARQAEHIQRLVSRY
jgi:hypothetical protein